MGRGSFHSRQDVHDLLAAVKRLTDQRDRAMAYSALGPIDEGGFNGKCQLCFGPVGEYSLQCESSTCLRGGFRRLEREIAYEKEVERTHER